VSRLSRAAAPEQDNLAARRPSPDGAAAGVSTKSLYDATARNPHMTVLTRGVSEADWEKIVAYYLAEAPDTLPPQSLPAEPQLDPPFFKIGPFASHLRSSGIITLLKTDAAHQRIFVARPARTCCVPSTSIAGSSRHRRWPARRRT